MPIYEYQCSNCGHQLEALQNLSEAALTHCPECGQDTLKKKVSAAGFQLKGTGWYATDFKDKPATKKDDAKKTENTPSTEKASEPGKSTTESKKDST